MLRPVVEIQAGSRRLKKLLAGPEVTIGRDPENSIAFNDSQLSAFHCLFEIDDTTVELRDLNSNNGTFVNGQRINEIGLEPGDKIEVGRIALTFLLEDLDVNIPPEAMNPPPGPRVAPPPLTSRVKANPSSVAQEMAKDTKPEAKNNPMATRFSQQDKQAETDELVMPAGVRDAPRAHKMPKKKNESFGLLGDNESKLAFPGDLQPTPEEVDKAASSSSLEHMSLDDLDSPPAQIDNPLSKVAPPANKSKSAEVARFSEMNAIDSASGPFHPVAPQGRHKPQVPHSTQPDPLKNINLDVSDVEVGIDQVVTSDTRKAPQVAGLEKAIQASIDDETIIGGDQEDSPKVIAEAAADHVRILRQVCMNLEDQAIQEDEFQVLNTLGQPLPLMGSHETSLAIKQGMESGPILRLMLLLCQRIRATDLHIEPRQDKTDVRLRVDGVMVNVIQLHPTIGKRIGRIVKVMGQIDIAQQNMIQEGHFSSNVPDRRIHYRISFTPSLRGQKLVIRILDAAQAPQRIQDLGFPDWMSKELQKVVYRDTGMVLVCGPTGSGKTSTLYSLIREIDRDTRNVVTIEDPVEYEIDGTTQLPIDDMQGQNFANVLRSVLRQDPDVLLIGEIRDSETANIAMQAAMTGHLVFSTVHAKDTVGALFRLMNLDVDKFLLASSIHLIIAQRLARLLCLNCRESRKTEPWETRLLEKHNVKTSTLYVPVGCPICMNTGYSGRSAFFEMLTATDNLRDLIMTTPQIQEIRNAIGTNLFASLHETGYNLVAEGRSSLEEIERLIGQERS